MRRNNYRFSRIYFDYAASTPVAPEVLETMKPYFTKKYGNPGSLHYFGQEALAAVDKSRETIARIIGADFREIIFTGSATEANNLALRGVIKGIMNNELRIKGQASDKNIINSSFFIPRIIVSSIEHESILETARDLEREGVEVLHLPVDREGYVMIKELEKKLNERTVLVSVMYANNEIGTIQPISEIAQIIRNFREELRIKNKELGEDSKFIIHNSFPLFHTDAVQAFAYLDCNVNRLGVDLMTLSAHKIYGPKGIGALYVRNNELRIMNYGNEESLSDNSKFIIHPLVTGGGQEFSFRSGTENVPAIVGFAKAAELVDHFREKERKRIAALRDYFWHELKKIYPQAEVNGIKNNIIHNSSFILPNILNVYFPGHLSEDLLIKFDQAGLAVSTGAACSARSAKPSHVLQALGFPLERIKGSLRFSFGRFTTKTEIKKALSKIKKILK